MSTGENVQKWTRVFSFFSDASERRVKVSAESKILALTFERFRLYRLKHAYYKPFKYAEVKPTCFVANDLMSNSNAWPIRVFRIFILEISQKMGVFDFFKNGHEID